MLNYNGKILSKQAVSISPDNRAFKYGDGIFETIKVEHKKVLFIEDHYFRLMASARMLRMQLSMNFLFTKCFHNGWSYLSPKTLEKRVLRYLFK